MTETKVPAGAKKPADRKPKVDKPREVDGHLIVTVRGVECRVPKESLDDLEIMESIEVGNWLPALKAMLPPYEDDEGAEVDQVAAVKAALRGESGRVKYSDTVEFLNDLMAALAPNS